MAEDKKPRRLKKTETVRQKAEKATTAPDKPRRLKATAGKVAVPLKSAANVGRKEYYLPLPDNKAGRFFNKRRHFIPRFFREAWGELRLVKWPGRKETAKLTVAVFVFAIVFGTMITLVDYGLDKLFKHILLK